MNKDVYASTYIFGDGKIFLVEDDGRLGPVGGKVASAESVPEDLERIVKEKTGLDVDHLYENISDDVPKKISFNYKKEGGDWTLTLEFLSEVDSFDELECDEEYTLVSVEDVESADVSDGLKRKLSNAIEQFKALRKV